MFIGHFAAGYAAKRFSPSTSLGTLFAAALFLDVLWPVFVLVGLESFRVDPGNTAFTPLDFTSYPWSHSLASSVVWAALFGGAYAIWRRRIRGGIVVAAAVASHWFLDFLTHGPDLPLVPGGSRYGLGLWNSPAATIVVESVLFAGAVLVYARSTRAKNRIGSIATWSLVGLLALLYAANAVSPAPETGSERLIAWVSLTGCAFIAWAAWADHHRSATP